MGWLERNRVEIAAYERARARRETVRVVIAGIVMLTGIGIVAGLLL